MISKENINKWIQHNMEALPAYLAYFDIADFKRRNIHLGHVYCDKDIEDLLMLSRKFGIEQCVPLRVAGDEVIMLFDSTESISELNAEYFKEEEINVGLKVLSKLKDKELIKEISNKTLIYRCLHIVFKEITSINSVYEIIERMNNNIIFSTPNSVNRYDESQVISNISERWTCINNKIQETPYCLFCNSTEFCWHDGDSVSGIGDCKHCGALIDYIYY